jgi:LDH2 family malate/lactate/ureidoglycolate dehydrogenase
MYCREVASGQCDGAATPRVVKETVATALVDGRNGIGSVVGEFSMDLAITKAKKSGCAWVTATGSNHYGIVAHYTLRAVDAGLIGISVTNTSPLVVPTRAQQCVFGTNPLSFAAPSTGDPFVLDMATSTAAIGKVEIQARKELPIPSAWGVDKEGKETHNPHAVLDGGGLMPLGGPEATAGYKGYGLAMMVEVMCGMMGGGMYAHHIRKWSGKEQREADMGQSFIAVDPEAFAPNFQSRLGKFIQEMRQLKPSEDGVPVLVAGDPERAHIQKVKDKGGIFYHTNLLTHLKTLADQLSVDELKTIKKHTL